MIETSWRDSPNISERSGGKKIKEKNTANSEKRLTLTFKWSQNVLQLKKEFICWGDKSLLGLFDSEVVTSDHNVSRRLLNYFVIAPSVFFDISPPALLPNLRIFS